MTGPQYQATDDMSPWDRYQARSSAANRIYLTMVINAHNEYLTGPWPDRQAYDHAERSAWMTYYAVCRQAWRTFEQEITPPPPPPAPSPPDTTTYPVGEYPYHSAAYQRDQPAFTPAPGDKL